MTAEITCYRPVTSHHDLALALDALITLLGGPEPDAMLVSARLIGRLYRRRNADWKRAAYLRRRRGWVNRRR